MGVTNEQRSRFNEHVISLCDAVQYTCDVAGGYAEHDGGAGLRAESLYAWCQIAREKLREAYASFQNDPVSALRTLDNINPLLLHPNQRSWGNCSHAAGQSSDGGLAFYCTSSGKCRGRELEEIADGNGGLRHAAVLFRLTSGSERFNGIAECKLCRDYAPVLA